MPSRPDRAEVCVLPRQSPNQSGGSRALGSPRTPTRRPRSDIRPGTQPYRPAAPITPSTMGATSACFSGLGLARSNTAGDGQRCSSGQRPQLGQLVRRNRAGRRPCARERGRSAAGSGGGGGRASGRAARPGDAGPVGRAPRSGRQPAAACPGSAAGVRPRTSITSMTAHRQRRCGETRYQLALDRHQAPPSRGSGQRLPPVGRQRQQGQPPVASLAPVVQPPPPATGRAPP